WSSRRSPWMPWSSRIGLRVRRMNGVNCMLVSAFRRSAARLRGREPAEYERHHLLRGGRIEVRENDDHIAAVGLEGEVPVHPGRAAAVSHETPAANNTLHEPVCV